MAQRQRGASRTARVRDALFGQQERDRRLLESLAVAQRAAVERMKGDTGV